MPYDPTKADNTGRPWIAPNGDWNRAYHGTYGDGRSADMRSLARRCPRFNLLVLAGMSNSLFSLRHRDDALGQVLINLGVFLKEIRWRDRPYEQLCMVKEVKLLALGGILVWAIGKDPLPSG